MKNCSFFNISHDLSSNRFKPDWFLSFYKIYQYERTIDYFFANYFQFYFINRTSFQIEQSVFFFDSVIVMIISIRGFVFSLYYLISFSLLNSNFVIENSTLESLWTCFPVVLMVILVMPSLRLLYMLEESFSNEILLKTIGHQWYWTYEYPQFDIAFDSYIVNPNLNENYEFRVLDVDNRVVLPTRTPLCISSTSEDVLHSWTVPSWALKIDRIPGKINQTKLVINKSRIRYGQCSEICGANHSFIPISVETVSLPVFINWLRNFD